MPKSLEEIASNLSEAEEYLGDFVIKATEYLNDLDYISKARADWGLFRDRRPECYKDIVR